MLRPACVNAQSHQCVHSSYTYSMDIVKVETKISISIQAGRLNLRRLCAYAIGLSTKLACADLVTYRAIAHWLGHIHVYIYIYIYIYHGNISVQNWLQICTLNIVK